MQLSVTRGGADLAKISRELRKAGNGKALRKELSKEFRAAAKPLVPAVRASIAAIPTSGTKSSGLRTRLQKATRLRVQLTGKNPSVAVLVDPKRMPDKQKALPAYMEGTKPRWRHPVYGRDTWVTQRAHPYFYKVVAPLGKRARAGADKALATITKQIT